MPSEYHCSACGLTRERAHFSKNQLKKGDGKRRCKPCIRDPAKNAAFQSKACWVAVEWTCWAELPN